MSAAFSKYSAISLSATRAPASFIERPYCSTNLALLALAALAIEDLAVVDVRFSYMNGTRSGSGKYL
jgi:hypothetical protein